MAPFYGKVPDNDTNIGSSGYYCAEESLTVVMAGLLMNF